MLYFEYASNPTPRKALSVGPSVGIPLFLHHLTQTHTNLIFESEMQKRVDTADISVLIFSFSCANFSAVYAHCGV